MSRNEEIVTFVNANQNLEGMTLSAAENRTLMNCLTGKTTYNREIKKVLAKYRKAAV